jgi:3-oxoacyl-[acyl-carrier-protein] synthase-3
MLSRNFEEESHKLEQLTENPYIAFEKEFLRWMLSDGASAVLLKNKPEGELSLKVEWVECTSFAGEQETCMYVGAEKLPNGELKSWSEFEPHEWLGNSTFSLRQDTKILSETIVPVGGRFLQEIIRKRNFDINTIDYFLPHLSSMFFKPKIQAELKTLGLDIPDGKWFTNLSWVGNVGSASIFLMLEELFNSDKLKKGQKILLMVPESARFNYAYALLTVV